MLQKIELICVRTIILCYNDFQQSRTQIVVYCLHCVGLRAGGAQHRAVVVHAIEHELISWSSSQRNKHYISNLLKDTERFLQRQCVDHACAFTVTTNLLLAQQWYGQRRKRLANNNWIHHVGSLDLQRSRNRFQGESIPVVAESGRLHCALRTSQIYLRRVNDLTTVVIERIRWCGYQCRLGKRNWLIQIHRGMLHWKWHRKGC